MGVTLLAPHIVGSRWIGDILGWGDEQPEDYTSLDCMQWLVSQRVTFTIRSRPGSLGGDDVSIEFDGGGAVRANGLNEALRWAVVYVDASQGVA